MKNLKRFLALGLAAAMAISVAACGNSSSSSGDSSKPAGDGTVAEGETKAPSSSNGKREILIGAWWTQFYDSTHTSVYDDDSYSGDIQADMKFENVAKIEERYGLTFKWVNLTYEGTKESINNSILAGAPDCDIYLVDTGMAIPAQVNGLCTNLKDVLPADHDIFTDQKIASYVDMGDGKACIITRVEKQKLVEATYPLAYNKQLLEAANLEDPRELYEKGEWTWAKFEEYLEALHNTSGDSPVYGFVGFPTDTFEALMFSNGGTIAAGTESTLTNANIAEALEEEQKIFQTWSIAYTDDDLGNSDFMRNRYHSGDVAFWPSAAWIASGNGDYGKNEDGTDADTAVQFDTVYVPWPVGPSGDKETNYMKNAAGGEFYIIPAGVEDPELVFNVLYDMWNWFDGDTSYRDDEEALWWWYSSTARDEQLQVDNFNVMSTMGEHTCLDIWQSLGFYYDFVSLLNGSMTAAQFQETYKQQVQDALDSIYG